MDVERAILSIVVKNNYDKNELHNAFLNEYGDKTYFSYNNDLYDHISSLEVFNYINKKGEKYTLTNKGLRKLLSLDKNGD